MRRLARHERCSPREGTSDERAASGSAHSGRKKGPRIGGPPSKQGASFSPLRTPAGCADTFCRVPVRSDKTSPITDPDEAQRFDLSSRILRLTLLIGGTQWLFVAGLLHLKMRLSLAVAVLIVLVGIVYTLGLIRYFAALHRRRLSHFTDPRSDELRVPGGRLPLPRRLRRAPWVFVLVEIAVLLALPTAPRVQRGSVPRPPVHFHPGQWRATGTILATDAADANPGEVIERPWTFRRVCAPSCHTFLIFEAEYGPTEAVLVPHAGFYTAAFPPYTVPCVHRPGEDAGSAQEYSVLKLWWSGEEILAIEHSRYVSDACPGGPETTRWVVVRTTPGSGAPGL